MGAIGCTTPLKDGPHRLELPNGELAVQQIPAAPVLPPTATIKDTTLLQRQHGGLKRGKWGTGTSLRLGRSSCSPPARRLRRTRTFFLWNDSAVSKVAAAGDPAPGGGSFWAIGTERIGFVDGTTMPTGPLGAINDVGLISFRGYGDRWRGAGGDFPLGRKDSRVVREAWRSNADGRHLCRLCRALLEQRRAGCVLRGREHRLNLDFRLVCRLARRLAQSDRLL